NRFALRGPLGVVVIDDGLLREGQPPCQMRSETNRDLSREVRCNTGVLMLFGMSDLILMIRWRFVGTTPIGWWLGARCVIICGLGCAIGIRLRGMVSMCLVRARLIGRGIRARTRRATRWMRRERRWTRRS